jgi:hypothetical protein
MTKPPKRPRDTNQLAKLMVDILTARSRIVNQRLKNAALIRPHRLWERKAAQREQQA